MIYLFFEFFGLYLSSIIIALVTGGIISLFFYLLSRKDKSDFYKKNKGKLFVSIKKIDKIFCLLSDTLKQFDNSFDSDKIIHQRIIVIIETYMRKIAFLQMSIHIYASESNLTDNEENDIDFIDEVVDWFTKNYSFSIKPTFEQELEWKNLRNDHISTFQQVNNIKKKFQ